MMLPKSKAVSRNFRAIPFGILREWNGKENRPKIPQNRPRHCNNFAKPMKMGQKGSNRSKKLYLHQKGPKFAQKD